MALVGTWRWNNIQETALEWGPPVRGPAASMAWMCLCIQLSRCSWGCCDIPGIIPCAHSIKTDPWYCLSQWVGGLGGTHQKRGHIDTQWCCRGVLTDGWCLCRNRFFAPIQVLVPPELTASLLWNLRSLTHGGATFLSACWASRMSEHCLQGWYSAAGHAEQSGCATCSPGSLLCQVKVFISCRGRITPLQMHLPHCAVQKALYASVREEGRQGWPCLWVSLVHSAIERYIFMLSGVALLFQLLPRPRCYWRLKRGERTAMCFTKRMQRWGRIDCLMHAEIQIQSKGKAADQAAQQSPWKWPGYCLN